MSQDVEELKKEVAHWKKGVGLYREWLSSCVFYLREEYGSNQPKFDRYEHEEVPKKVLSVLSKLRATRAANEKLKDRLRKAEQLVEIIQEENRELREVMQ